VSHTKLIFRRGVEHWLCMGFFKDKVLGRAEMYWKVDHGRKTGNDEEECSRGLF